MAAKFKSTVTQLDAGVVYELSGVVDENSGLASLTGAEAAKPLLVDTSGISRVNSFGVRDWVTWITKIELQVPAIGLCECPPGFVGQLGMVRNFIGTRASVCSVLAPFLCDACGVEKLVRVPYARFTDPKVVESFKCEACTGSMVFDDIAESYFAFGASVKPPVQTLAALFDAWEARKFSRAA